MNTQKIDNLISFYEKRLSTLRNLKSLIESDPELASEVVRAFMAGNSPAMPVEPVSTQKKASQYDQMLALMKDGEWHTVPEIADAIGAKKHSIAPYLYKDGTKDLFESRKHPGHPRMMQWRLKQPEESGGTDANNS